jgi:hypothetical protein
MLRPHMPQENLLLEILMLCLLWNSIDLFNMLYI